MKQNHKKHYSYEWGNANVVCYNIKNFWVAA
jgi:hypothetical protein